MLTQATKDRLKALGINADELTNAIKDEKEVEFKLPDGSLLTDDQLLARDDVKLKEGEKKGEKEAINIAKKEIAKHAGIDLKSDRWGDVGTEIKAAINATGDDKVKQLQEQNRLLLADKDALTGKVSEAETRLKNGLIEVELISKFPSDSVMTAKERFELAKIRGFSYEATDTGVVAKLHGNPVTDTATHAPLPIDKGINTVIEQLKLGVQAAPAPAGGRGVQQKPSSGGNGGIKTFSQAEAYWKENNPGSDLRTPEGMAWYQKVMKETPDFKAFE